MHNALNFLRLTGGMTGIAIITARATGSIGVVVAIATVAGARHRFVMRDGHCFLHWRPISHQISAPVINEFITSHDPRQIMEIEKIFPAQNEMNHGMVTLPLSFVSTYDDMRCLSSSTIKSSLVVDSGASVCISPHKEDFIVYGASTIKIKDLSSSNNVAGEG
jgi:hypothetical protein